MSSRQYFNFIGSAFGLLPEADKERMGELWHGYEQIFASVYQKYVEVDLNIAIQDMVLYSTERWLPYVFNNTNRILRAASFTGNQDLSLGVNLTSRFLLRFRVDGGSPSEVDCRGVIPGSTSIDEIISKINAVAGFPFASGAFENSILKFKSSTIGPGSTIEFLPASQPALDAVEFLVGLLPTDLPFLTPEFRHSFVLPYQQVASIPLLQDRIRDESVTLFLEERVDYQINRDEGVISFREAPLERYWAKRTQINEESPWNNFGFLMDIYEKNSRAYLRIVQGLWYAFWTGPRPENLRRALYLLFGLPVALEDATVTAVSSIEIVTTTDDGINRPFPVPTGLTPIVVVGQRVDRFQPLVDGILVFDKINSPGFIKDEVGRAGIQRFLLDEASRGPGDTDETRALRMLEEHTFLPQISVDAFISPDINLGNVRSFLEAIKPLHKTFLFQVIVGTFEDELPIQDKYTASIEIDVTPNLDSNQTTALPPSELLDYETLDNEAMDLDSDGVLLLEAVAIEVYDSGGLIESFVA